MKKALSLILALAMMLTMLVGCGARTTPTMTRTTILRRKISNGLKRTSTFSLATAPAVTLMFVPATWLTP